MSFRCVVYSSYSEDAKFNGAYSSSRPAADPKKVPTDVQIITDLVLKHGHDPLHRPNVRLPYDVHPSIVL